MKYRDAVIDLIKASARKFGIEISSYRPDRSESARLNAALSYFKTEVLFDVGANSGQFAKSVRLAGYTGRIVSFEPLKEAHKQLVSNAASDPAWSVHPRCAIGGQDGEIEINVSRNSVSSSILPILPLTTNAAPESAYVNSETVKISRLDSILDKYLFAHESAFLKLDTQGYEWTVLDGTTEHLKNFRCLQLEMSLVPLYEGQHLWEDFVRRLEKDGFCIWSIAPCFSDPDTGRTLQVDATFYRP